MRYSILIPAFNSERKLARTLDSLCRQSFTDWEALIIDDASTDGTAALAEAYAMRDSRFQVVRRPGNAGPAAARNAGIELARGEWIALLDADDAYLPDRLKRLTEISEHAGLDMVADNLLLYDLVADSIVGPAFSADCALSKWTIENLCENDGPGRQSHTGWLKPVFRRRLLEENNLRYRDAFRVGEDFLLYAELMLTGCRAAILNEALYLYTTPTGAVSGQRSTSQTVVNNAQLLASSDILIGMLPQGDQRREALLGRRARIKTAHYREPLKADMVRLYKSRKLLSLAARTIRHPAAFRDILLAQPPVPGPEKLRALPFS
ncbi:glycosyltransferase family 2 protein [Agrobacterium sp. NPDC089420]|uniref:glycosyltransferase family 2 protein n=1 Tax=Agrobacterium sp. NPDC089420 TaxID=3363918 RepID=UPI00384B909E